MIWMTLTALNGASIRVAIDRFDLVRPDGGGSVITRVISHDGHDEVLTVLESNQMLYDRLLEGWATRSPLATDDDAAARRHKRA